MYYLFYAYQLLSSYIPLKTSITDHDLYCNFHPFSLINYNLYFHHNKVLNLNKIAEWDINLTFTKTVSSRLNICNQSFQTKP